MYFDLNVIENILSTFFQKGIWVVGFFFLLNKTFVSKKIVDVSKVITILVLVFYLLYSIIGSV